MDVGATINNLENASVEYLKQRLNDEENDIRLLQ